MLTKTQAKIMKVFVSKITEKFSIKQVSEILKKPYPLIHRSIKPLVQDNLLIKDSKQLLSLNYKNNFSELSYIESLRKKEFLDKDKTLSLFVKDILEKSSFNFFISLIFGSSVESKNSRDIDLLFIIEDKSKINDFEKFLNNLADNFSKKFDINVISTESAYEMLSKRDNINVLNETLNKHIILFGGENYYKILKNAR